MTERYLQKAIHRWCIQDDWLWLNDECNVLNNNVNLNVYVFNNEYCILMNDFNTEPPSSSEVMRKNRKKADINGHAKHDEKYMNRLSVSPHYKNET